MANQEQVALLRQGSERWNTWRRQHPGILQPDLHEAYLANASLSHANLVNADLREANLSRANLTNADLREADMRNANLVSADLRKADLRSADLSFADLRGADLRGTDLRGTDLSSTYLTGTRLDPPGTKTTQGMYGEPNDPLIEQVLEEGERVLWQSGADQWKRLRPPFTSWKASVITLASFSLLMGLISSLGLVSVTSSNPLGNYEDFLAFLVVTGFLSLCIALIVLGMLARRGIIPPPSILKRMRYAVTDRRVIVATQQRNGTIAVEEALFNEITALQCPVKRRDGAGNLFIVLISPKVSTQGRVYQRFAFLGIPLVTEVKNLILQHRELVKK
jgi:hypothetical protein